MVLGMTTFTFIHVLISLVAILSGLVVLYGLYTADRMPAWTAIFLVLTVATSVTGFGFGFHGVTPAIVLGVLSLLVLAPTIAGRYAFHLAGPWRWVYVVGAVVALDFNVFVLIVQAFQKVPALHALAPTGSGPVFAAAQGAALVFFVVAGVLGFRRFHPAVAMIPLPVV